MLISDETKCSGTTLQFFLKLNLKQLLNLQMLHCWFPKLNFGNTKMLSGINILETCAIKSIYNSNKTHTYSFVRLYIYYV